MPVIMVGPIIKEFTTFMCDGLAFRSSQTDARVEIIPVQPAFSLTVTSPPARRVLIADDDRTLNLLLATMFKQQGWEVSTALDAMQVMMHAMRVQPHAIVLDINMPGGTGMEALKKLKASVKTAHIPVLVLSGTPEGKDAATVLELGAAAFVAKPATPEDVFARVANLLGPSAAAG